MRAFWLPTSCGPRDFNSVSWAVLTLHREWTFVPHTRTWDRRRSQVLSGKLVPLSISLHPYLKSHTTRFLPAALGWGEEEFFESVWSKSTSPRLGQMGGGCTFSEPSTLWHLWSPVVLGPQTPVSGSPTCSEAERLLSRQRLLWFWFQSLSLFPDSSVFFFSGHARSIFSIVSISLLLHWIWNSVFVLEERHTYTSSFTRLLNIAHDLFFLKQDIQMEAQHTKAWKRRTSSRTP